jgi:dienelactone hydrolase
MKGLLIRAAICLVALSGLTSAMHAELTVLETEVWGDGTAKIVFEDTGPPMPYSVERYEAGHGASPWQPLPWYVLLCKQPARFEVHVPGAALGTDFYRVSVASGSGLPLVIATDPANGAEHVPPNLEKVSLTFDRPMKGTASLKTDPNWGASFVTWSADRRTAEIHRLSAPAPLPSMANLRLELNAGETGFVSQEGKALPDYALSFTTGTEVVEGPYVVRSVPTSGARDVDPYLDTVEFHFSEAMMPVGGFTNSGWWPWTLTWSDDGKIAYARRGTAGSPLYGHTAMLIPIGMRGADGEEMTASYTLQFTTSDPPMERVAADPEKGFYWPYYLFVPSRITTPGTLLIEPNNTGTWGDDPWLHERSALSLLRWRSSFAVDLGCPLLVPVFPRPMHPSAPEPGGIYIHALDRYSLTGEWTGIGHIDDQMAAMIGDALDRLRAMGHTMDDKVFMMGFSASGAFTSRFAALHPELLKAAAPGSPGGWPCAPVSSWQGVSLPYPFGIQDIGEFNLDAFRQVALYIYIGGTDTNDAVDFRGIHPADQDRIKQLLHYPDDPILANRWPLAESIYTSVGANATFVVYPGVPHTITGEMFDDLLQFFRNHR